MGANPYYPASLAPAPVPTENLVLISVTGLMTICRYALQGESVQGHMPWRGDNVDSSNAFQVPVCSFPGQVGARRRKPRPASATRYPAAQLSLVDLKELHNAPTAADAPNVSPAHSEISTKLEPGHARMRFSAGTPFDGASFYVRVPAPASSPKTTHLKPSYRGFSCRGADSIMGSLSPAPTMRRLSDARSRSRAPL